MKKYFAFSLFCFLLPLMMSAQQPTVRLSSGGMKLKNNGSVNFTLFGVDRNHIYAHNSNLNLLSGAWTTNYLTLYQIDNEGNITAQKELKSLGKKTMVRKAFLNGDSIALLVNSHFRNADENKVLLIRLSVKDLEKPQEITNPSIQEMEGDLFISSPDTSWIGCFKELDDNNWKITLYDRNFEEIYSREMILQNIKSIFVTNEAEVLLMGIMNDGSGLFFQIVNEEQDKSYSAEMDFSHISSLRIANYKNGRIYAGGLTFRWSSDDPDKRHKLYNGCHSLMFDTKTEKLETDHIQFTQRDISILTNDHISKKNAEEEGVVNNLPMADAILSTENNTVFAYQYIPSVLEQNNFYQGGLFLFNIDNDGHIGWHHFLRRSCRMPNELSMVQFLFEYKGKPSIVYSISSNTGITDNEEKPVETLRMVSTLSKSATIMAVMQPDGTITKFLLDEKSSRIAYATIEDQGKRTFMMNREKPHKFLYIE